ncbi:MAG: polysaccharide deacetylase family protein [Steroidobacteraceae bacterium]
MAQAALHLSGMDRLVARRLSSAAPTILMYHSICDDEMGQWIAPGNRMSIRRFEQQMRFLAQERNVVSLDKLLDLLDNNRSPPAGTVIITFDDGYLDNLHAAAPVLSAYGLPAVLYLATGYVERGENQWADVLYSAFIRRSQDQLVVDGTGTYRLNSSSVINTAYAEISKRLLTSSYTERTHVLQQVVTQLRPSACPPRLTMNWDEARQLRSKYPGFQLGIHTADHLDLSAIPTTAAVEEIMRSMADFSHQMSEQPRHFSFPYSRETAAIRKCLPELGLTSAMATSEGMPHPDIDPFNLGRLISPSSMSLLGHWTSGTYPMLSRSLFGRS